MTDQPKLISRSGIRQIAASPREAYEDGMPLHIVRRRFHLSDSEVEDILVDDFLTGAEATDSANKVSGY